MNSKGYASGFPSQGHDLSTEMEACAVFSQELVENDSSRGCNVQGLFVAEHRNTNPIGGALENLGRQTIDFMTEENRYRE